MRTAVIVTISVLVLFGAAFAAFGHVDRTQAQPVRDLSKMMSVRLVVSEALSAHYQQYHSYPRSLSELPLQTLRWGDEGSTVRDAEAWSYVSDGSSFTMTWTTHEAQSFTLAARLARFIIPEMRDDRTPPNPY